MNEVPRQPKMRATTQAAEGVPRLRWTLAEFERLGELGVLEEGDRIELVGGELVPMSPKGNRHEVVRDELMSWLIRHLPHEQLRVSAEIGWRPREDSYVEPDILVCPRAHKAVTVPAREVLLVIEVADTSFSFDTSSKAALYAALGVREYWVVDANSLRAHVFREPGAAGYLAATVVLPQDALTSQLVPAVSLRMADLPLT